MSNAYLAPSLVTLRNEINLEDPKRDKSSDGWIGDPSHAARASDHNPDSSSNNVVRATDTDKDGIDANRLVSVAIRDRRTNYVIFNGYIYSRAYKFAKRVYNGTNQHQHHVHISILHGTSYENDTTPWGFGTKAAPITHVVSYSGTKLALTGRLDSATVKKMQELFIRHGAKLKVDGGFGPITIRATQRHLGVLQDGILGPNTVRVIQRHVGAVVDGKPGPNTIKSMQNALNRGRF